MSKSLGTLTLDLVAKISGFVDGLSKAERASAKSKKQFEKDLNDLKRNIKFASAAFAAGAAAMIGSSVKIASEVKKLSDVAGVSAESFQKYSYAAKTVGIENEKLSDILKDVNDKVGDFLQTGAGPMADFFEKIAPSIGVTADQFRNLSSEDALGLYVSSLEKANLSQSEMTFYLEAIASDSAKLLPLLKNNSSELNRLGVEADKLGLVMSELSVQQSKDLTDSLAVISSTARGVSNEVVANFIPVMAEMASALAEANKQSGFVEDSGETLTSVFKAVAQVVVGAVGYIDTYAKALAGVVFIASQVPEGFDAIKNAVSLVGDELDANIKKYDNYLKRVKQIGEEAAQNEAAAPGAAGVVPPFGDDRNAGPSQNDISALEDSFKTELELLQEKHEQENELLAQAREQKLETVRSYDELELMLAERQAEQMRQIDEMAKKQKLDIYSQMFSNLSTLMNTESRKAFEIGKAAAYANAVVNGYEAAVASYEKGASIGGPPLGAAFAATSLAATGAQIQAISSTKFGGGGGGAGSGVSNTQAVNNASQGVQPQQQAGQDRNVFLRGINKNDLYSGEQLLDLINNELSNGGKIIANG